VPEGQPRPTGISGTDDVSWRSHDEAPVDGEWELETGLEH